MLVIFLVLIYLLFAFFSYFLLPQACKKYIKFVSESVFQIEELTVACFPTYNNNLYF
jgi:hypothetical protein